MEGQPGSVVVEVKDGIAWVALDRPEKRNALDGNVWRALGDIGIQLCADSSVRVAILYGKGKSFCAGLDLNSLTIPGSLLAPDRAGEPSGLGSDSLARASGTSSSTVGPIERSISELQGCFSWLQTAPFPTIAAVHGDALGAGWQLALSCDFVLAAKGSEFGMLETSLGLVPDMGGTARLVRSVGVSMAKYLILTGRKMTAEELLGLGLVAEIVNEDSLLQRAEDLAYEFTRKSPTALRLAKHLIDEAFMRSMDDSLRAEAAAQRECITSLDFLKAVSTFLESRTKNPSRAK